MNEAIHTPIYIQSMNIAMVVRIGMGGEGRLRITGYGMADDDGRLDKAAEVRYGGRYE